MNIRLTILLVFVLILFGGTFLWFQNNQSVERIPKQPWMYKVDDNSIVHIEVTHDGQTGKYDKKAGGTTWYIQNTDQDTPVSLEKWSGTPLLLSGPQVRRVLAQTIDNPASYGLDPPASVVKVTERSGITYEFHMGDATPDGENQYATLVGDPQLFTLPQIWADVINKLATKPPYVRLYYVNADNLVVAIGVEHNGQNVEYHGLFGGQEWVVAGETDQPVDPDQWSEILKSLTTPPVSRIVSSEIDSAAKYGLEQPQTRVEVVTMREDPFIFSLGSTTEDGQERYARVRGRQELFTVPAPWVQMLEDLVTKPIYSPESAEVVAPNG